MKSPLQPIKPRKLLMYGAYDNVQKDKIPRLFYKFKKDAENAVSIWKENGYFWAKKAGVRRVEVTFPDETRMEIRTHEYKTIHT